LKWNATDDTYVTLYIDLAEKDLNDLEIHSNPANAIKMSGYPHPLSGSVVIRLEVPSGAGEVTLSMKSGKEVRVDTYLDDRDQEGKLKAKFDSTCVRFRRQVGTPGTVTQAITVGSYDWNDQFHFGGQWRTVKAPQRDGTLGELKVGQLSAYSSPGPSRSGKITKPDIVAPGQWFTASLSKDAKPTIADTTHKYELFNGTSAATPYTAGIVALMMQKKPTITVGEIKSLIQSHASKDSFTGETPNDEWGCGKLDYKAVTRLMAALE
jgi:subtilisin family serine protease